MTAFWRTLGAALLCAAPLVVGCPGLNSETAFFVSLQEEPGYATTLIQLGGERCILWSAATGRPAYRPEGLRSCSGAHPVAGGQPVAWRCESPTGSVFPRIELGSRTYELAQGRLFVLSAADGTPRILQLNRDVAALPLGELSAVLLADPEVQAFLALPEDPPAE